MAKLRVRADIPSEGDRRAWRIKIFVATWLSYVGFYFCRRPFNAVKANMGAELHWSSTQLSHIGVAYLIAYAAGQFLASGMGTRLGPRRNVLLGMGVSIVVTLAMGVTTSVAAMAIFMALNGVAQATGWSGNVGSMAPWFHKHERGRVMGLWSTNFTAGALLSSTVMARILFVELDWRYCFVVGAAVLAVIWVVFYIYQRNKPEDVGLPPIDDPKTPENEAVQRAPSEPVPPGLWGLDRRAWTNLFLVAGFYFCSKLVRYLVWSWAPYFLQNNYGFTAGRANFYATMFDLCGLPGVYLTGWISDKYFGAKRSEVALLMMIGMTVAAAFLFASANAGAPVFIVVLCFLGFTLYGPDALLSGAGAMDIGGRHRAAFAAAMISGVGSCGPIVQELVIGEMYQAGGSLAPIFLLVLGSSFLAMLFCGALALRNRRGGNGI